MPQHADAVIDVASPSRRSRALWLAFADHPAEHRAGQVAATLAGTAQGRLSLEGLFAAQRDERLVGAIWGQVMPGNVGVVWPAQLIEGEPEATAVALHRALRRHFDDHGVCVAQASITSPDCLSAARLRSDGFTHFADVLYLAVDLDGSEDMNTSSPLEFQPYAETEYARFTAVMQRTYEQTLDCPALNGVRAIDDVLVGYRQTGKFRPERWLLVCHDGRDVGCLLLTDHSEQDQWELVYMGICPEARGNGWGRDIARQAIHLATQAGRRRLVLAVDAKNAPALAMYESVGFAAWERRSVFLKILKR